MNISSKSNLCNEKLKKVVCFVWRSLPNETKREIFRKLDVITDEALEYRRNSMACTYRSNSAAGIFLNEKLAHACNPYYTVAHEFAHVYLDHVTSRYDVILKETEAHRLAATWGYASIYGRQQRFPSVEEHIKHYFKSAPAAA